MNVPKLRFKEFTGEWKEKYLREVVCSLDYGMGASACEYDGVNKYIRITDIDDVTHKYLDTDIVSPNGELCDKYVVRPNDILFARTGASTGKTYLYDEKDGLMYFAGFLIRANVKTEFDANFIYGQTLLNRYKKWVGIESMRSGQPGINAEQYSKFTVNVPVYEEQKKISSMLGLVDDKISNCYKIITSLEIQKKGLMQKIFSQELRFKDEDGKEFPAWEEKKLNQCAEFLQGLTYLPTDVSDFGTLVLRSSNIKENAIVYDDNVFVNLELPSNLMVKENDILMCVRNGSKALVGKTALIKACDLNNTWGAFMMIIRSSEHNNFLYYWLNSELFAKQMFKDLGTATINQITKGMLNECTLKIPAKQEQNKIAEFLTSFDEKINGERKILEKWQQIKKGLLQQMFV